MRPDQAGSPNRQEMPPLRQVWTIQKSAKLLPTASRNQAASQDFPMVLNRVCIGSQTMYSSAPRISSMPMPAATSEKTSGNWVGRSLSSGNCLMTASATSVRSEVRMKTVHQPVSSR